MFNSLDCIPHRRIRRGWEPTKSVSIADVVSSVCKRHADEQRNIGSLQKAEAWWRSWISGLSVQRAALGNTLHRSCAVERSESRILGFYPLFAYLRRTCKPRCNVVQDICKCCREAESNIVSNPWFIFVRGYASSEGYGNTIVPIYPWICKVCGEPLAGDVPNLL